MQEPASSRPVQGSAAPCQSPRAESPASEPLAAPASRGVAALAEIAAEVNRTVENIGARRLYTILERVFEELSFEAPDRDGQTVEIDRAYVEARVASLAKSTDMSRYVL